MASIVLGAAGSAVGGAFGGSIGTAIGARAGQIGDFWLGGDCGGFVCADRVGCIGYRCIALK